MLLCKPCSLLRGCTVVFKLGTLVCPGRFLWLWSTLSGPICWWAAVCVASELVCVARHHTRVGPTPLELSCGVLLSFFEKLAALVFFFEAI
jgi:hypothetical protein